MKVTKVVHPEPAQGRAFDVQIAIPSLVSRELWFELPPCGWLVFVPAQPDIDLAGRIGCVIGQQRAQMHASVLVEVARIALEPEPDPGHVTANDAHWLGARRVTGSGGDPWETNRSLVA